MPWVNVTELLPIDPPSKKEIEQVIDFRRRRAKAKFYADENFPNQAVEVLRRMGARVVTAKEAGRTRHPDENHAAYALKHGFILLTCDRDFLDERRFPLVHCPVIVVFNFGDTKPREADIRFAMRCLRVPMRFPQVYDKWVKIAAGRNSWTEHTRFLNGSTSKSLYRLGPGNTPQEWIDER